MEMTTIARGTVIRSIYGGYARIVEDGVLKNSVYVKKNTVFRVSTINLYTQTVIAIDEATKRTLSLEYDYILNLCEVVTHDKSTVVNGMAIVDTYENKSNPNIYTYILIGLGVINILLSVIFACIKFWFVGKQV